MQNSEGGLFVFGDDEAAVPEIEQNGATDLVPAVSRPERTSCSPPWRRWARNRSTLWVIIPGDDGGWDVQADQGSTLPAGERRCLKSYRLRGIKGEATGSGNGKQPIELGPLCDLIRAGRSSFRASFRLAVFQAPHAFSANVVRRSKKSAPIGMRQTRCRDGEVSLPG